MRRKDRRRDEEFSLALIDRCTHGVMALNTEEGIPYCLPLTFARVDKSLYFHCAKEGRKLELLRRDPRVCITFVGRDDPTYKEPAGYYTTMFASAIVTGSACEVTQEEEKVLALRAICAKTLPAHMQEEKFARAIAESLSVTAVWRVDMEEISGKSN